MSRARTALVGLLIGASFYLLLIDTVQSPELIAGAVAAVLAAAAYGAAHTESVEVAAIRLRWLGGAWRALREIPIGIAIVCAEVPSQLAARRPRRGVIRVEPFDPGDGGAYDLGRWALTEFLRSLAPHSIVIGVDPDSGRLLIHHLRSPR